MNLRTVAHIGVGLALGCILAGIILIGIAGVIGGGAALRDPEGIGLLVFLLCWSIPCVLFGLIATVLMRRAFVDLSATHASAVSMIVAGVVSGALFLMIMAVSGTWEGGANAFAMVPAIIAGVIAAGVFIGVENRSRCRSNV